MREEFAGTTSAQAPAPHGITPTPGPSSLTHGPLIHVIANPRVRLGAPAPSDSASPIAIRSSLVGSRPGCHPAPRSATRREAGWLAERLSVPFKSRNVKMASQHVHGIRAGYRPPSG